MKNARLIVKSSLILDPKQLTSIEQALVLAPENLQNFASQPDFSQKIAIAFGEGAKVDSLMTAWLAGDFSIFPEIEIRHTADINGANGAFAAATNKIYLSQEFIINHQGDVGAIARVILEEFGHWVDTQVNTTDAPGDEGDIFAKLVLGDTLTETELNALKQENDVATVVLDSETVQIEQASSTPSNPFYKYEIIAKTGDKGIQKIENRTSINDLGKVAFVGDLNTSVFGSNAIFVGSDSLTLTNIVPGTVTSNLQFGTAVQINNKNQVIGSWRTSGTSSISDLRLYNSDSTDSGSLIATGGGFQTGVSYPFDYYSVLPINSVNNKGESVFVAFKQNFEVDIFSGPRYELGDRQLVTPSTSLFSKFNERLLPGSATVNIAIADDGSVLVSESQSGIRAINLYNNQLSTAKTIAVTSTDGFTQLGNSPVISDDGQIVTFYGVLNEAGATALKITPGAGIFASINTGGTSRVIQRIAGIAGNGFLDPGEEFDDVNKNGILDTGEDKGIFSSFGVNSRIGVSYNLFQEKGLGIGTITYLASDQSGKEGLYTNNLSVSLKTTPTFNVADPKLVVKVGDTVTLLEKEGTVQDLEIYDPINQAGQIAFWASFSNGSSAILRADPPPPKVLNIATHGFGRDVFPNFLDGWFKLGKKLDALSFGTPLQGDVKTYVSNWDSSTGWVAGIGSMVTSIAFGAFGQVKLAAIAIAIAKLQLKKGGSLAENAAQTIVQDVRLSNLLADPELSQNGEQIIHLVGHSRGGAVNARVATLLTKMGYHIDQYTALDGYSTDWPGISSILSDISIPDEVNAADIERRVNYRVQNGLETKITTIFNLIKSELGDFSSATQTLVQNALPDWKAPERGGTPKYGEAFENYVIRGLDEPSDHLNITEIYTDSDTRPLTGERYILENFVGKQTTSSKLLKFAASFSSLSAEPDNAFTLNQSVAKSASSTTADDFSNFTDGSFEDLADLRQEILAVDFTPTDDEAINNWVAQARDASKIVTVLWDVVGNVKLVDDGTNAQVELVQTADTSLGQVLSFNDSSPQSIEFDLSVETVGEGDRLQVVFDNSVLTDLDLSTLPTNGHYSVSLAGLTSQFGELSFRLTGPQDSPAIVKLDNLSVLFKDTPPVNHPPTLNQAIASQTATEDAAFSFTFDANTFIDIDAGDSLNYKATLANGNPLPAWLNFNAATRTFSGTPTNSDVGTLSLKLTATDIAGVSSEDIFNLEVIKIDNPPIIGTSGRDVLTGTSKSDRIIGLQGGDTLTGGGGNDQFVYIDIRDRGDTITDFEVGKDKIVFTQLLDSLVTGGYNGVNAIADGYVKVVQGTSASNFSVQIDADGPTGKDIFRPLITVNLASSGSLNNPNNFVF